MGALSIYSFPDNPPGPLHPTYETALYIVVSFHSDNTVLCKMDSVMIQPSKILRKVILNVHILLLLLNNFLIFFNIIWMLLV